MRGVAAPPARTWSAPPRPSLAQDHTPLLTMAKVLHMTVQTAVVIKTLTKHVTLRTLANMGPSMGSGKVPTTHYVSTRTLT